MTTARTCRCPCERYGHAHNGTCTGTAETTLPVYDALTDTEQDRDTCQACLTAILPPGLVTRLARSSEEFTTRDVPVIVFDFPTREQHHYPPGALDLLVGTRMNVLVPSGHTVRGTCTDARPVDAGRIARVSIAVDTVDDVLVGQRHVVAKLYDPSGDDALPKLIGDVPTMSFGGADDIVKAILRPAPGQRFTVASAFAMVGQSRTLTVEDVSTTVLVVSAQVEEDGLAMDVELAVNDPSPLLARLGRHVQEEPASGPQ